jgi:hypothetical protein
MRSAFRTLMLLVLIVALASCGSSSSSTTAKSFAPRFVVLVDGETGSVDRSFPDIDRSGPSSAAADGEGGWYIGGDFNLVGNVKRPGLARLRSDGRLDLEFTPRLPRNTLVTALFLHQDTLYVGGHFGVIAFDGRTGKALWRIPIGGERVSEFAFTDGVLYVNGAFDRIGGVARPGVAALDPRTGRPTPWRVHLSWYKGLPVGVSSFAVGDGTLYISGLFNRVNGVKRELGMAAVSTRTARLTAWKPQRGYLPDDTFETLVSHGQVLVGGKNGFAVLDARTGRNLTWRGGLEGDVIAFAISGNVVYLGGDPSNGFARAGGKPANNLAAVRLPGGEFTSWRPDVARCTDVWVMAASGDKVLVGGVFAASVGC